MVLSIILISSVKLLFTTMRSLTAQMRRHGYVSILPFFQSTNQDRTRLLVNKKVICRDRWRRLQRLLPLWHQNFLRSTPSVSIYNCTYCQSLQLASRRSRPLQHFIPHMSFYPQLNDDFIIHCYLVKINIYSVTIKTINTIYGGC